MSSMAHQVKARREWYWDVNIFIYSMDTGIDTDMHLNMDIDMDMDMDSDMDMCLLSAHKIKPSTLQFYSSSHEK